MSDAFTPSHNAWKAQQYANPASVSLITLALTLTLAGCAVIGGTPAPTATAHVQLDQGLANQSVYVTVSLGQSEQNDGLTLALNAQTGTLRWKTDTGGTGGTPSVAGGAVYMAAEDGSIRSLDATTGKQQWSYARKVGISVKSGFDGYATASGDTIYVTSDAGALFALDAATGKPRWIATWPSSTDTLYAPPAVDSGMVFVAAGGPDGGAYALDAATGKTVWKTSHLLGFDARPVVANGVVYFASQSADTLVALDEKTGATRWSAGSSGIVSAPVAGSGLVYVAGADAIIRAFNANDGKPAWTFQTGGSIATQVFATGAAMTLDSGTLYAGSQGGMVYALDAATGKPRWSVNAGSPVDSAPAVADGAVFVATESGKVMAFRASDGAPAWSYAAGANALITSGPVVAPATSV
jgi:outer membrane protein assembly factor BamB